MCVCLIRCVYMASLVLSYVIYIYTCTVCVTEWLIRIGAFVIIYLLCCSTVNWWPDLWLFWLVCVWIVCVGEVCVEDDGVGRGIAD